MSKDGTHNIDWKEILMGEILLMGVLSKTTQSNPEKEWLQSLINEDIFSESPLESKHPDLEAGLHILQAWAQKNVNGISDENLTDLKADYVRLFLGLPKPIAPPWESVYFNEDRMIFQQQTLQVREWYRRYGLEAEKLYKEPDDHVGLELSFLAYLATKGIKALDEQDNPRFEEVLNAQRDFLAKHLGAWGLTWCGLVEKNARTDFYKGLAYLTRGALSELSEVLGVKLAKEAVA